MIFLSMFKHSKWPTKRGGIKKFDNLLKFKHQPPVKQSLKGEFRFFLFANWKSGLLLYGQPIAISKSCYYAWKICKIWWEVIAGRIWWLDEILWQNCAPSVIDKLGAPKKCYREKFYLDGFLGPIKFDSPNGGTSNSRIKKMWTLPLRRRQ